MNIESAGDSHQEDREINTWAGAMSDVASFDKKEDNEKCLDPRVESLAIPLARDYAEKNYAKREDGTFEPAWRGVTAKRLIKISHQRI